MGRRARDHLLATHELRIESRNLNDVSARYPELRALGLQLGSREAVLDGEIVAFDEHGRPSFERLQRRMHVSSPSIIRRLSDDAPVNYLIFDLLYLDGHTTIELPYRERRALLEELGLRGPAWQTPAYHAGEGRELLAAAAEQRLEGVVAKRLDSPYRPGKRTDEWLKIKNVNRQELVIGGWLPGKGARAGRLGALLMGYYEPAKRSASAVRTSTARIPIHRSCATPDASARASTIGARAPGEGAGGARAGVESLLRNPAAAWGPLCGAGARG